VAEELDGSEAHLVLAFVSPHHADHYDEIPGVLSARFPGSVLIGCSANGVIGAGHEVEQRPGFSLTTACLPGVSIGPFSLRAAQLPEEATDAEPWRALVGKPPIPNHFVLIADPLTFDATALLTGLDVAFPDSKKIGGLASGGPGRGSSALFVGSSTRRDGAVGVALSGNILVDAIVAQGCRPIGTPTIITRCQNNVVLELDGRPPLLVLRELYASLPDRDQELFRTSLFAGLEMKSEEVEFHAGDFLVRNLVGIDPEAGAIAIGAVPKPWQVLQFLLRDSETATEDLRRLLERYRGSTGGRPQGALLFSCLGRGVHLFGKADHDTGMFQESLGPVPLGGFFCNGEIGPVGRTTFLHGYTSAFALFREAK
jgi:small ligand-binding sensory domain FIST